jgi:hypothetical protein
MHAAGIRTIVVEPLLSLPYPEPVATGQYDHAKGILSAQQAKGPPRCVTELLEVWHQCHIITIVCGSSTDAQVVVCQCTGRVAFNAWQ